jgi:hypothetical protein
MFAIERRQRTSSIAVDAIGSRGAYKGIAGRYTKHLVWCAFCTIRINRSAYLVIGKAITVFRNGRRRSGGMA